MTDDSDDCTQTDHDSETLYERMELLEPYTTGELSALLDLPRRVIRELLESLNEAGQVRKKEPEPDRTIWIREPPVNECRVCGYRFEIKILHPVLGSVRYCPRCGDQL